MRALIRWVFTAMALFLLPQAAGQGALPPPARAQSAWAAEPTYRFAGRYEGDWTAAVWPESPEAASAAGVFEQRAGALQGTLVLDVACDGSVRGQAQGQTATPAAFAAVADGDQGPRVLSASLDAVLETAFAGALSRRVADGPTNKADTALTGSLRDLPSDVESVAAPVGAQRWYTGTGTVRWALLEGQPGRLAGDAEGLVDLGVPPGQYGPHLALRASGRWVAARVAVALCPWRGDVVVSGAFGNEQLQSERVELSFRPTDDGHLAGEARGEADIRGGTPGGCEYSGGGPFALQVSGEALPGRFRLRLDDADQPPLLVTTTCASGRFVGPQALLSTLFGWIELPEAVGAAAHLELPATVPDARGTLDVTIAPVEGAAPP